MQNGHNTIYNFYINQTMSYNVQQITINMLHMTIVKTNDMNSK